jgi:hypothetical protein
MRPWPYTTDRQLLVRLTAKPDQIAASSSVGTNSESRRTVSRRGSCIALGCTTGGAL